MQGRSLVMGSMVMVSLWVGCARDDEPRAPADAIPAKTDALSGSVTLGTVGTRGRESVSVDGVRLTKTPITVHDYRRCVESGFCAPPERKDSSCIAKGLDGQTWTASPEKYEDVPVTCTTADQAARYCRWVGGRLPRIDEWELAARGRDVHRYPWGDAPPTCDQIMRLSYRNLDAKLACGGSPRGEGMKVGTHAAGHGAGILDDVLVTRGEYVTGIASKEGASCAEGTTCVMRGGSPGAIEQMTGSGSNADLEASGFRCAWGVQ